MAHLGKRPVPCNICLSCSLCPETIIIFRRAIKTRNWTRGRRETGLCGEDNTKGNCLAWAVLLRQVAQSWRLKVREQVWAGSVSSEAPLPGCRRPPSHRVLTRFSFSLCLACVLSSHIGLGPTQMTSLYLTYLNLKAVSLNTVIF